MIGNQTFDSASTVLEKESMPYWKRVRALVKSVCFGPYISSTCEEDVEVGKILTVTFTTAATEGLRERIRSLFSRGI